MAQAVPNLFISKRVFLKNKVNWNTVCGAMQDLPWHNIWSAENPLEFLNKQLFAAGWSFCFNQGHLCAQQGYALV